MHTTTSRERARRERPTLQELGVVCNDGGGDDYGHQPTKSEKKVLLPTPGPGRGARGGKTPELGRENYIMQPPNVIIYPHPSRNNLTSNPNLSSRSRFVHSLSLYVSVARTSRWYASFRERCRRNPVPNPETALDGATRPILPSDDGHVLFSCPHFRRTTKLTHSQLSERVSPSGTPLLQR